MTERQGKIIIAVFWCVLVLLGMLTSGAMMYYPSYPKARAHPVVTLPVKLFWGIAAAESSFDPLAVGRDGLDRGLWQFRSPFDAERGIVDPFDPLEATEHAIRLFSDNFSALGSVDLAITSHRRGRTWARRNGIDVEYLRRVYSWQ